MPFSFINQTKVAMWSKNRSIIKRILAQAVAKGLLTKEAHVNVIVLNDTAMQGYNVTYKGKDYPTDVLTFVSDDSETLADIFINVDACTRQAIEYQHSIDREFAFLFAHGLLHACGYDHHNEVEESTMIQLQKELLREYPRDHKALHQ